MAGTLGPMRVIGIDPGLRNSGWAVLEQPPGEDPRLLGSGTLTPSGAAPLALRSLYQQLQQVLQQYQPQAGALESVFFGRNVSAASGTGEARGVIRLALAQIGIVAPADYTPQRVKKQLLGAGKGSKQDMANAAQRALQLLQPAATEHEGDAQGIALTLLSDIYSPQRLELRSELPRRRARTLPEDYTADPEPSADEQLQLLQTVFPESAWNTAEYRRRIQPKLQSILALRAGSGELVGLAYLHPEPESTLRLNWVAVHPQHRGLGLGRWLVVEAQRQARERGAAALLLRSAPWRTPALKLYRSLDFT